MEHSFSLVSVNQLSDLKPFQNPDMTNVYEFVFMLVERSAPLHLPHLVRFLMQRVLDSPRKEAVVAGLLCSYCSALCGPNDKARHALQRLFSKDVLRVEEAAKKNRVRSLISRAGPVRGRGRASFCSAPALRVARTC